MARSGAASRDAALVPGPNDATPREARARASQIRAGALSYLDTLALVKKAQERRDWLALGYDSYEAYVAEEFSALRLRVSSDLRDKAVAELRLAGLSQREIGQVLGISAATVNRSLAAGVSNETRQVDMSESPSDLAATTDIDGMAFPGPKLAPDADTSPDDVDPGLTFPADQFDQLKAALDEPAMRSPLVDAHVLSPTGDSTSGSGEERASDERRRVADALAEKTARDRALLKSIEDDEMRANEYLRRFLDAVSKGMQVARFDAERLADILDADHMVLLAELERGILAFAAAVRRHRTAAAMSVRLIQGGAS